MKNLEKDIFLNLNFNRTSFWEIILNFCNYSLTRVLDNLIRMRIL